MPTPSRAAIYARISLDAEGEGKGVQRQTEDCRRLANRLGWTVIDEYVDNDISAYSGKVRPEYQRMLIDIESGAVDGVLIYHLDRLTRRPIEFEQFNIVATKADIPLRCVAGDMDLGTDDGLMMGRYMAAGAAYQSSAMARRQRRKNDEKAAAGLPHGGSQRPFGFEEDRVSHRPTEAAVIQQLAERFLAGESLRSLATWLDEEGIRTVNGGPWRTNVVRLQLTSPRIAGLREHRGEIVGRAAWKPIISAETRTRLLAAVEARRISGRRTPRRYLLSGLLRCSKCGRPLYSQARRDIRRYVCTSGPDHGGCGRITIVAPPVEQLIADAVLYRLDTQQLADALTGNAKRNADTDSLTAELGEDRETLDDLATRFGKREFSMRQWMAARRPIEERVEANERKLRRAMNTDSLSEIVGRGVALSDQWSTLNLTRQAAIVRAVLDHAVVNPGVRGAHSVDPRRVSPVWRL
jgi:site-specific DNA recombinase